MSAVWRASRAAVRRRRPQTFVIGLVVLAATATSVLTVGLLDAASAPFDKAFARQHGAHLVATFDAAVAPAGRLARTAELPQVRAAAGPFGQKALQVREDWLGRRAGSLTVVGRAGPAGGVDRAELLTGRWAAAPGEIVVNIADTGRPGPGQLGTRLEIEDAGALTVVGFATSMSGSAGGWVTPRQMAAWQPTEWQMLYRLRDAATDREVSADLAGITAGLPAGALTTAQSYLDLKRAFSAQADAYLPFMTVFGVLGLLVSVLIVGNVVSGAVVSGYRHIGVLKALGFTPNQVAAIYLGMVSVPGVAGSVLGALAGHLLAAPVLMMAFGGVQTGVAVVEVSPWVPVACLLGMPTLVAVAALIPALRAHRIPAARAISAGSAPSTGRALRIQRWLSGTRLPRSIGLGLVQPFARPGRAAMTMAAVALGVTAVTLATGLTATMLALGTAGRADGAARVGVQPAAPDDRLEAILRALPGAREVSVRTFTQVQIAGYAQPVFADAYRGDPPAADQVAAGRWPAGPGEVAAGPAFLVRHGLAVGDRLTLTAGGRQARVVVVGRLIVGNARALTAAWETVATLRPDLRAVDYTVTLAPGTDAEAYAAAVTAAGPGLRPTVLGTGNAVTATVVGFASVFTTVLVVVAAFGVFNTVLLNTRERRRDLGMLKAIGMTPRQVVAMTVTSAAALGMLAGLLGIPLGILTHRLIVDNVGIVAFPESMKAVWHPARLAGLALAGIGIAVLGALVPARSAARLTIARVLHGE